MTETIAAQVRHDIGMAKAVIGIAKALIWSLTIIAILILFRNDISDLLKRRVTVELPGGFTISAGTGVQKMWSQTKKLKVCAVWTYGIH